MPPLAHQAHLRRTELLRKGRIFLFFLLVVLPALRRSGPKPRLQRSLQHLTASLASPPHCLATTRLYPHELRQLCSDLLINPDCLATGNHRFTPLQRLALFLFLFGNGLPSRKLRLSTGWAAVANLYNWRYHIGQIVEVLDADNSRKCSSHLPVCLSVCLPLSPPSLSDSPLLSASLPPPSPSLADNIRWWTSAEQQEWLAAPPLRGEFANCIGIVDATYVRVQRPKVYQQERRLYSTYKKYHSVYFLAVIDRQGAHHTHI